MTEWKAESSLLTQGINALRGNGEAVLIQQTAVGSDGAHNEFSLTVLDGDGSQHTFLQGSRWSVEDALVS